MPNTDRFQWAECTMLSTHSFAKKAVIHGIIYAMAAHAFTFIWVNPFMDLLLTEIKNV